MSKSTADHVLQITQLLEEQNQIIKELIQVGEEQLEALKIDDIEQINATASKQENLGRMLALKEKERREIAYTLGKELNIDNIKLSDILKIVDEKYRNKLNEISQEIITNQEKLHDINETSKLLLRQSLQYVQKIMNCIDPPENKIYGSSGQIERTNNISSLNRSV